MHSHDYIYSKYSNLITNYDNILSEKRRTPVDSKFVFLEGSQYHIQSAFNFHSNEGFTSCFFV